MWKKFSARKLMSEVSEACPIRILLIEDQTLLRELLARTLAAEPDFKVAGQCASVREAFEIVSKNAVNMVLLDINSRAEQGGAFLNGARGVGYRGKVLAVTAGLSEREAAWLLHRGCSGIFPKEEPADLLVERIRAVIAGTFNVDSHSVNTTLPHVEITAQRLRGRALTPRESEVLHGVREGLTNKEIAERLGISQSSVKSFLRALFAKTGARTRAHLVVAAIEQYWDQV